MSYKNLAVERGAVADEPVKLGPPMPCSFCRAITAHETLRMFGARCLGCYRAYCEAPRTSPDTGSKKAGPKAWAWALRHRELTGERLTGPQRKAWREALAAELATEAE